MREKENIEEKDKVAKVIEKKIQYGESEYSCFACGEIIKVDTKVCPYCNTPQDRNETILK